MEVNNAGIFIIVWYQNGRVPFHLHSIQNLQCLSIIHNELLIACPVKKETNKRKEHVKAIISAFALSVMNT